MKLEPVIGLEIHVQLKTKTKMFCGCSNRGEFEAPNTTICPVCTGQPGILPVINQEAVKMGILAGLALNCSVNEISKFDRKQYFYPDLPKGYQISQLDLPVVIEGFLDIDIPDAPGKNRKRARIGIERLHLEEDAAKNTHSADGKHTLVDYNRGGTPLAEIVTKPDIKSPGEAKIFLQELRKIMRYLGVSDADMEKGHLRCDANISLREYIDPSEESELLSRLNPKTEVKNLNSFKAVERALEYEIKRQIEAWEEGNPPSVQTTRGWDDDKGVTTEQRSKEEANDYRYFPEPDLPPMNLKELGIELKRQLPELPQARKYRFMEEYFLNSSDAGVLTDDLHKANYTERVFSELTSWLMSLDNIEGTETEIWQNYGKKMSKLFSGWFINKLGGLMIQNKIDIRVLKITPENFAEFIAIIYENTISGPNALKLLELMMETGGDPSQLIEEHDLASMNDDSELTEIYEKIINANPKAVEDYKAGKEASIMFLVGQVMKESKGKANPETTKQALIEKIQL